MQVTPAVGHARRLAGLSGPGSGATTWGSARVPRRVAMLQPAAPFCTRAFHKFGANIRFECTLGFAYYLTRHFMTVFEWREIISV
jgi:hypothetical protein